MNHIYGLIGSIGVALASTFNASAEEYRPVQFPTYSTTTVCAKDAMAKTIVIRDADKKFDEYAYDGVLQLKWNPDGNSQGYNADASVLIDASNGNVLRVHIGIIGTSDPLTEKFDVVTMALDYNNGVATLKSGGDSGLPKLEADAERLVVTLDNYMRNCGSPRIATTYASKIDYS